MFAIPLHGFPNRMHVKTLPFILLFLLLGCAAPHDNPYDPESDYYVPPPPAPIPVEYSARVWSEHVSRIFPTTDLYQVRAKFSRQDLFFILDSVWVKYNSQARLPLNITSNYDWERTFSASYFGGDLETALGNPFYFEARDVEDSLYQAGPVYMFRVIEDVPVADEPDSNDVITALDTLVWRPFGAAYPFSYYAQVYFRDNDSLVWDSDLLPDTMAYALIPDTLENGDSLIFGGGDYEWMITVIDSFGNSSRSKEARFTIASGAQL